MPQAKSNSSLNPLRFFSLILCAAVVAGCLCLLAPACFAHVKKEHLPVIELPANEAITSIVSKIVKHGDLRDSDYIAGLLGVKATQSKGFAYLIKQGDRQVYFAYRIRNPSNYNDQGIADIEFNVPSSPCIKYTDFKTLFSTEPKEIIRPPRPGGEEHIFQKDLGNDIALGLLITTRNSCAEYISIGMGMLNKTVINPK